MQALSIDISLGAVVLSTAMAKYLDVALTWPVQVTLFLSVWLIYSFDHLMDSDRTITEDLSYRHFIHGRYRRAIVLTMILAILVGVSVLFLLPAEIVLWGVIASAFIVIYFLLVRYTRFWAKEVFVAVGYTVGVFLAPMVMADNLSLTALLLVVVVFLIALTNLLLFSYFDVDFDRQLGFPSTITRLGQKRSQVLILGILILSISLSACLIMVDPNSLISWVIGLMNLCLLVIMAHPSHFDHNGYYRVVGDGIFLLPIAYLAYAA